MSSTVAKALTLLEHFSEDEPEIGLSGLARMSGLDKATVHRMLGAMADAGLLEQAEDTKLYRLGAGVLRLARVRETAFPMASVIEQALEDLAEQTGETAHASLISGSALATVGIRESIRSNRVSLVAGEILPFHSTASGFATLAFGSKDLRKRVYASVLKARTDHTTTNAETLRGLVERVEQLGYAVADQTNEEEVYGIAMPIFDRNGVAKGAMAVATPTHRINDALRNRIISALVTASERVTSGTGGRLDKRFADLTRQFKS